MYRSSDDKPFDTGDAQLMSAASSIIAGTLRAGQSPPCAPAIPRPQKSECCSWTIICARAVSPPAARAWCEALNPHRVTFADGVPSAIWNVVGRLLGAEHGVCPHLPPYVRMRTRDGSWGVVEAARLQGEGNGIVVTMWQTTSLEVLGLVSRAHALSPRECQVLALLLAGSRRHETAERLSISRYTVEDHVKSILGKVGVRSRRELVTGVFGQAAYDAGASWRTAKIRAKRCIRTRRAALRAATRRRAADRRLCCGPRRSGGCRRVWFRVVRGRAARRRSPGATCENPRVDARAIARSLSGCGGRAAVGAACFAAPELTTRVWSGDDADRTGARPARPGRRPRGRARRRRARRTGPRRARPSLDRPAAHHATQSTSR
jgi:DNA-binding CsgD family transcriptional regulator